MSLQRTKKARKDPELTGTIAIMGALGRMPPKPHEEMKLGKATGKKAKSPVKRKRPLGQP